MAGKEEILSYITKKLEELSWEEVEYIYFS